MGRLLKTNRNSCSSHHFYIGLLPVCKPQNGIVMMVSVSFVDASLFSAGNLQTGSICSNLFFSATRAQKEERWQHFYLDLVIVQLLYCEQRSAEYRQRPAVRGQDAVH